MALERRARPMLFRVYPTTKARSPQMRLWEPQSGQEMRRLQMQTLARPKKVDSETNAQPAQRLALKFKTSSLSSWLSC